MRVGKIALGKNKDGRSAGVSTEVTTLFISDRWMKNHDKRLNRYLNRLLLYLLIIFHPSILGLVIYFIPNYIEHTRLERHWRSDLE